MTGLQPAGLSHSDIRGSILVCKSPRLFAAFHVLRRLQEPRHPPYALSYFLTPAYSLLSVCELFLFFLKYVKELQIVSDRLSSNFVNRSLCGE